MRQNNIIPENLRPSSLRLLFTSFPLKTYDVKVKTVFSWNVKVKYFF